MKAKPRRLAGGLDPAFDPLEAVLAGGYGTSDEDAMQMVAWCEVHRDFRTLDMWLAEQDVHAAYVAAGRTPEPCTDQKFEDDIQTRFAERQAARMGQISPSEKGAS